MSERKTENPFLSAGALSLPFMLGKAAFDAGLMTAISAARLTQIAVQSADTALARYIELTEQEMRRSQKRESVKVE